MLLLSSHRDVELAPVKPLVQQSALLRRLAERPRGTRSLDPLRNLPMLVGIAPLSAYRTLDRPVLSGLVSQAGSVPDMNATMVRLATRLLGASIRVFDPFERASDGGVTVVDPELASWIYGQWARRNPDLARFRIFEMAEPASRAWFLPGVTIQHLEQTGEFERLRLMNGAIPFRFESENPEHFRVEGVAPSPGTILISVLHDSGWKTSRSAPSRVFSTAGGGALQGMEIEGAGPVQVSCQYHGNTLGLWISLASWGVWVVVGAVFSVRVVRHRSLSGLI